MTDHSIRAQKIGAIAMLYELPCNLSPAFGGEWDQDPYEYERVYLAANALIWGFGAAMVVLTSLVVTGAYRNIRTQRRRAFEVVRHAAAE
jgi:hypothetical protein